MGRMSKWERVLSSRAALRAAEADGRVADSLEVRTALMGRVDRGEITLAEAQAELKRIKRGAKKAGLVTRDQAYRGR